MNVAAFEKPGRVATQSSTNVRIGLNGWRAFLFEECSIRKAPSESTSNKHNHRVPQSFEGHNEPTINNSLPLNQLIETKPSKHLRDKEHTAGLEIKPVRGWEPSQRKLVP